MYVFSNCSCDSEMDSADRNRALLYYMKSKGVSCQHVLVARMTDKNNNKIMKLNKCESGEYI